MTEERLGSLRMSVKAESLCSAMALSSNANAAAACELTTCAVADALRSERRHAIVYPFFSTFTSSSLLELVAKLI